MNGKNKVWAKVAVVAIALVLLGKWYAWVCFSLGASEDRLVESIRQLMIALFPQEWLLSNFPLYLAATILALAIWLGFVLIDGEKLQRHFIVRKEMIVMLGLFFVWFSLLHYDNVLFLGVTLMLCLVWLFWNEQRKKQQEMPLGITRMIGFLTIWFFLRSVVVLDLGRVIHAYDIIALIHYGLYMAVIYCLCSGWQKASLVKDNDISTD